MTKADGKKALFGIVIGIIVIALGQLAYDEIKKYQTKKAIESTAGATPTA